MKKNIVKTVNKIVTDNKDSVVNYGESLFVLEIINPDSALDFVAKLNYSIIAGAHGLFLKKEYNCILNLKMVVSSWFWRKI